MFRILSCLCVLSWTSTLIQAGESLVSSFTGSGKAHTGRLCMFPSSQYLSLVPKNVFSKMKLKPTDTIHVVIERPKSPAVLRPHIGMIVPSIYRKAHQTRVQAKLPGLPATIEDPNITVKVFGSKGERLLDKKYTVTAEIDDKTGTQNEHIFCAFNRNDAPKIDSIHTNQTSYTDSFWSVVENRGRRAVTYHIIPTQSDFNFWINQVPHLVTTNLSTKSGGKKSNTDISHALGLFFKRLNSKKRNPIYCEHVIALLGGELHPAVKEKYNLSPASAENLKRLPYFSASQVLLRVPSKDAKALLKTHKIIENKTKRTTAKVTLPNGLVVTIKGRGAMVHRKVMAAKQLKGKAIQVDDMPQAAKIKGKKKK